MFENRVVMTMFNLHEETDGNDTYTYMQRFTKHHKSITQERLMILTSASFKFIKLYTCQ